MITKEKLSGMVGQFIWLFGQEFFIETSEGNFIWRDPDYQGDGSIIEYKGTLKSYLKKHGIPFGRDKGKHLIGEYCGDFTVDSE